jgi:hypothetical protein
MAEEHLQHATEKEASNLMDASMQQALVIAPSHCCLAELPSFLPQ